MEIIDIQRRMDRALCILIQVSASKKKLYGLIIAMKSDWMQINLATNRLTLLGLSFRI